MEKQKTIEEQIKEKVGKLKEKGLRPEAVILGKRTHDRLMKEFEGGRKMEWGKEEGSIHDSMFIKIDYSVDERLSVLGSLEEDESSKEWIDLRSKP